ncbi:MAG: hypothetical protein NWE89_13795 [Candidatus Bathyarchaeota archaeon]|nr:hypothetical protein [Candidatus Bathyarchaeota archaeon]
MTTKKKLKARITDLERELKYTEDILKVQQRNYVAAETKYKNLQKAICKLFENADCVVIQKNAAIPADDW